MAYSVSASSGIGSKMSVVCASAKKALEKIAEFRALGDAEVLVTNLESGEAVPIGDLADQD